MIQGYRVKKPLEVLLGHFDPLQLSHALGCRHGIENQVVIRGFKIPPSEKINIGIVIVLDKEGHGNRRSGLNRESSQSSEEEEKGPIHSKILMEAEATKSR